MIRRKAELQIAEGATQLAPTTYTSGPAPNHAHAATATAPAALEPR